MSELFTVFYPLLRLTEDEQFNPDTVTPGVLGFAMTALVALAVIFLCLDLNRRLRRSRVRADIREKLAAEQAAATQVTDSRAETSTPGARD